MTIRLLCLLFLIVSSPLSALESVRLQLKWRHQFQFAGYYAAIEQGYYQDAGLNVELIEATPETDPAKKVLSGEAEYGIGNSSLLLSRGAGDPLVVLAAIFQHSPFVLLTQNDGSPQTIHDMVGKELMFESLAGELIAYLNHEGITADKYALVDHTHDLDAFMAGKVFSITSYVTDEPYILRQKGIPFHSYSPRSAGIDFYGDNLFTSEEEVNNHPDRVRKFREASLRGWRYAMNHQAEVIDLILNKYSHRHDRDFLAYEARSMQRLMRPELIDIGYMHEGRWRHIADTYADLGMLHSNISLKGFIYDPDPKRDFFWFYFAAVVTLSILIIVTLVSLRFSKLNKQLSQLLVMKSQFANIGESVNNISHQWKQPLNELGIQLMLIEQTITTDTNLSHHQPKVREITDKSHRLLEFMANTVDAFGNLLSTNNKVAKFSVNKTIQDVLYLLSDNFRYQQIKITFTPTNDLQLVGNANELAHVILNLLNNARDIFLERNIEAPRIHIRCYHRDENFHIEVSDNAGGIDKRLLSNIFNLGYSGKQTADSGVGLYIARQLIENAFNGRLEASNREAGALFTITLPVTDVESP